MVLGPLLCAGKQNCCTRTPADPRKEGVPGASMHVSAPDGTPHRPREAVWALRAKGTDGASYAAGAHGESQVSRAIRSSHTDRTAGLGRALLADAAPGRRRPARIPHSLSAWQSAEESKLSHQGVSGVDTYMRVTVTHLALSSGSEECF